MIIDRVYEEDGEVKVSIDLTEEEIEMIKEEKGWNKLTDDRLNEWFQEVLKNGESLE